jgi:2-keto-3-deoxy-6-phosphogluconate aldolase
LAGSLAKFGFAENSSIRFLIYNSHVESLHGLSRVPPTGGVELRNWISWSHCNSSAVGVISQLSLMTPAKA